MARSNSGEGSSQCGQCRSARAGAWGEAQRGQRGTLGRQRCRQGPHTGWVCQRWQSRHGPGGRKPRRRRSMGAGPRHGRDLSEQPGAHGQDGLGIPAGRSAQYTEHPGVCPSPFGGHGPPLCPLLCPCPITPRPRLPRLFLPLAKRWMPWPLRQRRLVRPAPWPCGGSCVGSRNCPRHRGCTRRWPVAWPRSWDPSA